MTAPRPIRLIDGNALLAGIRGIKSEALGASDDFYRAANQIIGLVQGMVDSEALQQPEPVARRERTTAARNLDLAGVLAGSSV